MLPIGSSRHRWLNQSTHSRVANSTSFQTAPWSVAPDPLGLVEAVDDLGQGVDALRDTMQVNNGRGLVS